MLPPGPSVGVRPGNDAAPVPWPVPLDPENRDGEPCAINFRRWLAGRTLDDVEVLHVDAGLDLVDAPVVATAQELVFNEATEEWEVGTVTPAAAVEFRVRTVDDVATLRAEMPLKLRVRTVGSPADATTITTILQVVTR